jgi:hypothetical protein
VSARVDVREARVAGTTKAGAIIHEEGRNRFQAIILKRLFCVYFGGDMVYKAGAFW